MHTFTIRNDRGGRHQHYLESTTMLEIFPFTVVVVFICFGLDKDSVADIGQIGSKGSIAKGGQSLLESPDGDSFKSTMIERSRSASK